MKIDLFEIFWYGADFGQALMEDERESEEIFDAYLCAGIARKISIPSNPVKRRQLMSDEWREEKRAGWKRFLKLKEEYEEYIDFLEKNQNLQTRMF